MSQDSMLYYLLDGMFQNLGGTLAQVLYFMLEITSFTAIFLLLWGLVCGLVLSSWKYSYFLLGIIILGIVGPEPAWILLTQGFPNFSTLTGMNGILP